MKRLFPILLFVAIVVSFALPLAAQQAPTSQPFSLSAAGQSSATIQFSSPVSSCGVVVYNGGTFTLVPQSSNDGTTWVTASGINSGSISATGSYTGGVANTGLKSFRVLLTAVDSTTVTGLITCSNALARVSGGGGPTPTPFVPSTPAAGNCIGISTPPAAGTIAYTCATPGPQATPSPTGAGNIVWSGSWPYTSTVATPSPTASTGISITGSWPYTIAATGGGGSSFVPPLFVQTQIDVGSATSDAPSWNYTPTSGNLLISMCAVANAGTISASTGWTQLGTTSSHNSFGVGVFYKTANGTDTPTITFGTSGNYNCYYVELAGAGTPSGYAGAATSATRAFTATTSPSAGSVAFAILANAGSVNNAASFSLGWNLVTFAGTSVAGFPVIQAIGTQMVGFATSVTASLMEIQVALPAGSSAIFYVPHA